jgi:class 3 adenylate cyclase
MTQVRLGDQVHRRMNVLVCNLRQFSDLSASMSPADNFRFINSFLRTFGPMVRSHGGFTSRYLGPGMLALFANDATDAIKAALTMRANLLQYNEHRNSEGYRAIDFGISIHIGDVMIGIIGEEQRMESSVVSDQVRVAQEIEKVSDRLGSTLLLTAEALATCRRGMNANYRRLGAIQLYGEPQALELIDLYEGDTPEIRKLKQETKNLFESSVELYRNGRFVDAREGFVAVIKKNRWDLAAKLYFYACDQYSQQGVTADWNGSLRIS